MHLLGGLLSAAFFAAPTCVRYDIRPLGHNNCICCPHPVCPATHRSPRPWARVRRRWQYRRRAWRDHSSSCRPASGRRCASSSGGARACSCRALWSAAGGLTHSPSCRPAFGRCCASCRQTSLIHNRLRAASRQQCAPARLRLYILQLPCRQRCTWCSSCLQLEPKTPTLCCHSKPIIV